MAKHEFKPVHFHNVLGTREPVLNVADGDTVVTWTLDAHGFDQEYVQRAQSPNPMTGPFYVEGAEPNDSLAVRIVRITPTRGTGWTYSPLAPNVVDPSAVAALPRRQTVIWSIDTAAGLVRLEEPPQQLAYLALPLAPMIGCFGVAPAAEQAISTATSGEYGGNMDYRYFRPGTTAYFPVFAPGALFYLGDGHARQGDGEVVGTGIETSFEIEFTVRVMKNRRLGWPRGETEDEIFTVGNARPLDQALQHATTEMLRWLAQDYQLDQLSASHILGQAVRYDVGNVFDPAYTVGCRLSKKWLPPPIAEHAV